MDAGLKIAIENHAGDMQAREVKMLIEEAGRDFVGSCLDSGNPLWTIEDPHLTLETLAPYVLTSHVRDTAVWNTPQGAAVAWTRMGEGNIGIEDYIREFAAKCRGPSAVAGRSSSRDRDISITAIPNSGTRTARRRRGNSSASSRWRRRESRAKRRRSSPGAEAAARELEDVEASIRWTKAFLEKLG